VANHAGADFGVAYRPISGRIAAARAAILSLLPGGHEMKCVAMVLAVMAVGLCVVGCGGGGKYASPKTTMETMHAAAKAGDKPAVMACFCEDSRKKLEEMEALLAEFAKQNPELAEKANAQDMSKKMMAQAKDAKVEYGEEKIDGDTATLETTVDGRKDTAQFVKEKGAWKIKLPITDQQVQQMKAALEMMKKMPKGMMEGLMRMGEQMKKKRD
jgi:hypothetical protein